MKTVSEIVSDIRRRDKHASHTGGLDNCPLCQRETSRDSVLEELTEFPQEEVQETAADPQDPYHGRLKKIFGDM